MDIAQVNGINIQQIRIFVAAAQSGSFSMAAQQLYLTQPAVSKWISKLESQLDCKLFIRQGSGVELTKSGEALLQKWQLLLLDFDESLNIVQSARQPDQTIRIGCLTQQIHNKKISQLLEHCSNSGAEIFMEAQDLKYLHIQLINHKYDVIISYAFDIIEDKNIQTIPICKADLYLIGTARVFEDETSRGYSKLLVLSRLESKNSADRVMYVCRQMGYDFKYVEYYPNIASLEFAVRQGEGAMIGGDYILQDGDALLGFSVPKELDDNYISMAWLAETNKKNVMDFTSSVKWFIKANNFDI